MHPAAARCAEEEAAEMTRRLDVQTSLPPVLTVIQAAQLLGIGRTLAYELIRTDRWPTPVLRAGRLIKIPSAPLFELISTGRLTGADVA
jgi:predicted DNA-binding transcriptional regulator AlpA